LPMSHASLLTITPSGLAGIDPLSGAIKWQRTLFNIDIISLPILYGAGDVIYYVDGADIYALHSTTGAVIWQNTLPTLLQYGLIVQLYAAHGSIYGLSHLALTAFDGATGHILWNNTQSFSDIICAAC
jgi:outer membrane protein assembly factor BamB